MTQLATLSSKLRAVCFLVDINHIPCWQKCLKIFTVYSLQRPSQKNSAVMESTNKSLPVLQKEQNSSYTAAWGCKVQQTEDRHTEFSRLKCIVFTFQSSRLSLGLCIIYKNSEIYYYFVVILTLCKWRHSNILH